MRFDVVEESIDLARFDFDGTSEGELIPTTLRAGSHQGYDRVVREFAGAGIPRWWAHYTESTSAPGSGFPVPTTAECRRPRTL